MLWIVGNDSKYPDTGTKSLIGLIEVPRISLGIFTQCWVTVSGNERCGIGSVIVDFGIVEGMARFGRDAWIKCGGSSDSIVNVSPVIFLSESVELTSLSG
jgi:hypothetical protein